MQTEFAQYCKPQELVKDFGGTASKAEKKNVNLRLVSYRNITKLLYLKWKLKEKKQKKKTKRREKGYARNRTQDLRHASQSFTTRPRGTHT